MNAYLKNGLDFIRSNQQPAGGFLSSAGAGEEETRETTFATSLLCIALEEIQESQHVISKSVEWLKNQASENLSFNYWSKESGLQKTEPYPNDMDDTACAFSAINSYDPTFIDGRAQAYIARLFFDTETEPGGPYRTWLVPQEASSKWMGIDPVVNSNIMHLMQKIGVQLPKTAAYIENLIDKDEYRSEYYPDMCLPAYFLSRWYSGDCSHRIASVLIESRGEDFWTSPHNAALCMSALLRWGYSADYLSPVYEYLKTTQLKDGSWSAGPFCIETHLDGKPVFASSRSLSTAFCLEALNLYESSLDSRPLLASANTKDVYYHRVINAIRTEIKKNTKKDLQRSLLDLLDRILEKDKDKSIILLPLLVDEAFESECNYKTLTELSVISCWGWMAYTAFDDIMDIPDNEKYLPAAIYSSRQLGDKINQAIPESTQFHKKSKNLLDRIDSANAWELSNCRVPSRSGQIRVTKLPDYADYTKLADRSAGHLISALGVIFATSADTQTLEAVETFFENYLIARQLNDEAHDWEEDLVNGHINAVGAKVLNILFSKYSAVRVVNMRQDQARLRRIMWQKVAPDIYDEVEMHIKRAKESLDAINMKDRRILEKVLIPVENAVIRTRKKRIDAKKFINTV